MTSDNSNSLLSPTVFNDYSIHETSKDRMEYNLSFNYKSTFSIGDETNFLLPPNIELIGIISYVKTFENGNIFISGEVPPITGMLLSGTFAASYYGNIMTANIEYPGNILYELRPSTINKNNDITMTSYIMIKVNVTDKYINKEKLKEENEAFLRKSQLETISKLSHQSMAADPILTDIQLTATTTFKILVLYTKQAVTDKGSESSLLAEITLAVGNFNLALSNSNVDISVDYVAERIQEYDTYTEDSSMTNIYNSIGQSSGSAISSSRRYIVGAHAVQVVVKNGEYCGLGSYTFNGQSSGISVCHYGCIGSYLSLAHEVGHNIGLHHDLSAYTSSGINHGYCWDNSASTTACRRSVMAYASCTTPASRTNCDRVAYFSSPDITNTGNVIGTSVSCNNAQQLRNNIVRFTSMYTMSPTAAPLSVSPNTVFSPTTITTNQPSTVSSNNNKSANSAMSSTAVYGIIVAVVLVFGMGGICLYLWFRQHRLFKSKQQSNSMKNNRGLELYGHQESKQSYNDYEKNSGNNSNNANANANNANDANNSEFNFKYSFITPSAPSPTSRSKVTPSSSSSSSPVKNIPILPIKSSSHHNNNQTVQQKTPPPPATAATSAVAQKIDINNNNNSVNNHNQHPAKPPKPAATTTTSPSTVNTTSNSTISLATRPTHSINSTITNHAVKANKKQSSTVSSANKAYKNNVVAAKIKNLQNHINRSQTPASGSGSSGNHDEPDNIENNHKNDNHRFDNDDDDGTIKLSPRPINHHHHHAVGEEEEEEALDSSRLLAPSDENPTGGSTSSRQAMATATTGGASGVNNSSNNNNSTMNISPRVVVTAATAAALAVFSSSSKNQKQPPPPARSNH